MGFLNLFIYNFHFSATSSKDDLHRRIGGRCSTNNMKIVFKVCCAPDGGQNNTTTKLSTISTTAISGPYRPTAGPTTTPSTTQFIPRTEPTSTKKPTKKIGIYFLLLQKLIDSIFSFSLNYS